MKNTKFINSLDTDHILSQRVLLCHTETTDITEILLLCKSLAGRLQFGCPT